MKIDTDCELISSSFLNNIIDSLIGNMALNTYLQVTSLQLYEFNSVLYNYQLPQHNEQIMQACHDLYLFCKQT